MKTITAFFKRVNNYNVEVKCKLHLCGNRNFFSYDIAVVMLLFMKKALGFWLLTELVTVNTLNISAYGQFHLKICQLGPSLLLATSN